MEYKKKIVALEILLAHSHKMFVVHFLEFSIFHAINRRNLNYFVPIRNNYCMTFEMKRNTRKTFFY